MIQLPVRVGTAVDRNSILSINQTKVQGAKNRQTIGMLNLPNGATASPAQTKTERATSAASSNTSATVPRQMTLPAMKQLVQKGQKVPLNLGDGRCAVRACFGWNTTNALCDVDVSAFLLDKNGNVLGEDWFVFYGQTVSPDQSVLFQLAEQTDRELIQIDFAKLDQRVERIVFVLTINEAFEKKLNFSMMKDAYVRILKASDNTELVSFCMADYYDNVISMMIGEIYQHKGAWKFYAVGNGMARDLAGICQLYGVEADYK